MATILYSEDNLNKRKNAGNDMAKVGEPCNVDAHAKILARFMTMLCYNFVYTCTVHTDCDCIVVFPL